MQNKYFVYIPNSKKKSLVKIPQPWQKKIVDTLNLLKKNPFAGNKLHGALYDCRKIRIPPYRIIYKIIESRRAIIILEIRRRGNVSYD